MSYTPETDAQITAFTSISKLKKPFVNRTGTVSAEFARKLECERDQWRECAERLVDAFKDVPHDPFTIGYSNTQNCEKALAAFDRLKGETK